MGRLTKEQIEFYKENGYILLKNLIKEDELKTVSQEYDDLFRRKNQSKMESSWVGSDENFRQSDSPYTVKGIHNLQMHHAAFGKLLYNDDLLDALEDVMGTKNISLHHTKAHYKPPEKGAAYPMHQDYPYFPYENDSMVAAFIHLDDSNPENGGLCVYPGSHKLGPLEDFGPKEGSSFHYVDQKKFPIENATPVIAEAGDVVIFSYFLVHGSTPNRSNRPRRMFLIQLSDAHDKPKGVEFRRVSQEYDNLFRRKNQAKTESAWVGSDETFRESDSPYTVKGIHNLQMHHAVFGKLLYNDDLLDALEDVMGTKNIMLHHTKAHYKPPEKGASYPMHQKKFPIENATPVIAEAGDVVIFSYLLVHGSTPNNSNRPRRMFLIQLADAHDKPKGGEPGQPGRGWMLRGANLDRDATVANRAQD